MKDLIRDLFLGAGRALLIGGAIVLGLVLLVILLVLI